MKAIILFITLAIGVSNVLAEPTKFDSVQISTRARPLTNAIIKNVTQNGITFITDQGMIQVPFANLPPEFVRYKPSDKPAPVVVSTSEAPKLPNVIVKSAPKPAPKEVVKSELELAKEAKKRAVVKQILLDKVAACEDIIYRYDRQSSFSKGPLISTDDYSVAKAELMEAKAKLSQMN